MNKKLWILLMIILIAPMMVTSISTIKDDFECGNVYCGTGWFTDWTLSGGNAQISNINPYQGIYDLRSRNNDYGERTFVIDESSCQTINISFWAASQSLSGGANCLISYYNGTGYTTLKQFNSTTGDTDNNYRFYSYNVCSLGYTKNNNKLKISGSSNAFCYIDNIGVNVIEKNITPINDLNKIWIQNVYFSSQVLQGGTTEVFAQIGGTLNLTKVTITLKYPDNSSRILSMQPTENNGEWKASITDTFQVGVVSFNIKAVNNQYYDEYVNNYTVVQYNLNFVELVNKVAEVNRVLSVDYINQGQIQLHGTEYQFGQTAQVWLQLLNGTGDFLNNGVCYTDVYYPDHSEFIERALMTNALHDGIYYYNVIFPNIEGVYAAIALCYYTAGQTFNYGTNITMFNGTIDGGTINDTRILDGSYLLTTETSAAAGDPRRYNATVTFGQGSVCSNISQSLLNGISIGWSGRWNSNIGGDVITMSIFNYSNSKWVPLINTVPGTGTGTKSVTNSLVFNNITKEGFVNSTGSGLKIQFQDTSLADGSSTGFDYDYLYVSCDQLASPVWQTTRGSSEIHVTNPLGYRFVPETLCDGASPSSPACAYFIEDSQFNPEGAIFENISISNPLGTEITQSYTYTTVHAEDCTGVDSVMYTVGNTTTDLTDSTIYNVGTDENCVLNIPISLLIGQKFGYIEIVMDNYPKWEVLRANDLRQSFTPILDTCDLVAYQNNFTYIVPLNTTGLALTNNSDLIFCTRVKDDAYWFDYYFNQSTSITTAGGFGSYHYEVADYYLPLLEGEYHLVTGRLDTESLNSTYTLLNLTPNLTWSYPVRNLTFYPDINVNLTNVSVVATVNSTQIAADVWGYTGNISSNITYSFGETIWNWVGRYVHGIIN